MTYSSAVEQKHRRKSHLPLWSTRRLLGTILEAWTVPAVLVAAVLNALEPFGFKLDGVEAKTPTNVNEYSLVFKRPPWRYPYCRKIVILAENLDWKEADQFIANAHAGIEAVLAKSKAEIQSQQLSLAIHIQLKDRPRQEVTAPLLNSSCIGPSRR